MRDGGAYDTVLIQSQREDLIGWFVGYHKQISLGVAEACSGLHSLSALMIGSLLLGFLVLSSVLFRTVLFILSIPLSVAVNVLRIAGTAVLADYWQDIAFGFYHSFSGWLVFVAGFGGLWLIASALHRLEKRIHRAG